MSSEPEMAGLLFGAFFFLVSLTCLLRVAFLASGGSFRILLLFLHLLVATLALVVIGFFQAYYLVFGLELMAGAALLDFLPFFPDVLAVLELMMAGGAWGFFVLGVGESYWGFFRRLENILAFDSDVFVRSFCGCISQSERG